ncbi:MAG: pyruvate kinase [Acutalibacteraceae bacterium]
MRKTKIICTLGPSTDDPEILEQLVEEGMNVARFNFSHGTHEVQKMRLDMLKKIRAKKGIPVAALLDTKGPEIRLGDFENGGVMLEAGQMFTLTGEKIIGNGNAASVSYAGLAKDVDIGTRILIDDGLVELVVLSVRYPEMQCVVRNSGYISNHKGVNAPGVHLRLEYLSEKDKEDILFGIENGVDFIAASFTRSAEDIRELRRFLKRNGGEDIDIIAKIENQEGVDDIDGIIKESDGIMIARGDMGVELPEEEVPIVQKMIIKKVYEAGKRVITATQMLDSMIKNPRPTRAETTDVANAIYDGTSAIMLSGETAAGKFPVESLKTMVRIADRTEKDIDYRKRFFQSERKANPDVTDAICHATCTTAHDLNAKAIITVTKSGRSARMISRYRPGCEIIGCTISERVCRQLNLSWGVIPVLLDEKKEVFELFRHAVSVAKEKNLLKSDDTAVITSGVPIGISGTTNIMKVEIVE